MRAHYVERLMSNIFPLSKAYVFGIASLVIISGVILSGILAERHKVIINSLLMNKYTSRFSQKMDKKKEYNAKIHYEVEKNKIT